MPQLDVSTFPIQLFWLLVTFIIFVWGMVGFFIPEFHKNLEKRHSLLSDRLDKAQKLNHENEALRAQTTLKLKTASLEAQKILQEALQQAHLSKEKQLSVYEEHLNKKLALSLREIEEDLQNFEKNLHEIVEELVVEILNKFSIHPASLSPLKDVIKEVSLHAQR